MGRIVVGIDGSDSADRALAWAAAEARLRGSTLHLVQSWTLPPPMPFPAGADGRAEMDAAARRILDDALGKLDPDLKVECEIVNESPAQALVHASEEAELLVVGSRGRGGFTGLLLGSVGQQCAQHARCPVVIVPKPG